ncbi:MAG: hypothetical protein JWM04_2359 [Verrucomicrobiales bacterium]|jgi:cytochrome c553|nr:hypothetical protein [Verrucomicrobiales bacterium]
MAIAGAILVVLLLLNGLKPLSQSAISLQTNESGKSATVAQSQAHSLAVPISFRRSERKEPPQAPTQNWRQQLAALHGIGKLFGLKGEELMKQLQDYAEGLDAENVPAAVQELQELQTQNPTETGRDLQLRLLQKWGQADIRSAAEWTTQMPAGLERQEAIATMAGKWAEKNFAEAGAWAGRLSDKTEKQGALESVADAAIYRNPLDALKLARTLDASPVRDDIIARAAGIWASKAPDEAVSWAKQIPNGSLREQAISRIAVNWAATDPVAAGNLAANSLQAGPMQDAAVAAVVQRWSQTDAPGVTTWVNQFPEGKLRQNATAMLEHLLKNGRPVALRGTGVHP